MGDAIKKQQFCSREFTPKEVSLIKEVVETCNGISRTELAYTVCELLDWKRANTRLKARECLDLLERLEDQGILTLPGKREHRRRKPATQPAPPAEDHPWAGLTGSVEAFVPVEIELVKTPEQRRLFRELVNHHHYLGYALPYGARLQYLAYVSRPQHVVVACIQFSSPAWRMKVRDQWIGWDDATRGQRLQHVVNNSRFLVLPRIQNLASKLLSSVLKRLPSDWEKEYALSPYLVETLVDRSRYDGGCYRAANWIVLGETTGRGRMDRIHTRREDRVKTVMVYPLVKNARLRLRKSALSLG
jgi:hypothetical protein